MSCQFSLVYTVHTGFITNQVINMNTPVCHIQPAPLSLQFPLFSINSTLYFVSLSLPEILNTVAKLTNTSDRLE